MTDKEETELIDSILKILDGTKLSTATDILDSVKRRLLSASLYLYSPDDA